MKDKELHISVDRWKWRSQIAVNFLASLAFIAIAALVVIINSTHSTLTTDKAMIAACAFVLGVPSLLIIIHLLGLRGKEAMCIENMTFSDNTRLFRKTTGIYLKDISAIDILYRARPFSGISREYKVEFKDHKTGETGTAYLADYLVSRTSLELFVEQLSEGAGIEL